MKTKNRKNIESKITIVIILLIIILVVEFRRGGNFHNETHRGKEYLIQLEQMDLATVEEKINNHHKDKANEEVVVNDFNIIYEDTVFMGDSITESLSYNQILNEYNVIAEMGDTVIKATNHISKLEGIQPKNVVLLYGMNDVILFEETASWNSIDKFKEGYKNLINEIKSKLPNTNIYVQSPLPVNSKATSTNVRLTNENLSRFREAVKEVCEEMSVTYVDISILVDGSSDLHEADGIHFKREFYDKWLNYLPQFMDK